MLWKKEVRVWDKNINKLYKTTSLAITEKNGVIMAWTGLLDCEGKKVFEHDIVEGIGLGVVEWSIYEIFSKGEGYPTWVAKKKGRSGYVLICDKNFQIREKVVGNIYENPELFETVRNGR